VALPLIKPKVKKDQVATYSTRQRLGSMPKIPASGLGKRINKGAFPGSIMIISLILGFGGGVLGSKAADKTTPVTTAQRAQYISSESNLISSIANNVGQSVVSIDVEGQQQQATDFFGFQSAPTQVSAAGTGFIISADGTIMTNRHVVPDGTTNVTVTLADGTKYSDVNVLGRTSSTSSLDVAFLKIKDTKGKTLVPVNLGDSASVKVGEKVVAIGNALGQFQNTVTSGIISGYGRDVTAGDESGSGSENLTDLFQTDTAINSGNSGGPLVNMDSEVIGVNTAVAGNAQNIGFAIPINDTKGLINSVLKNGQIKQPYLGVRYITLTSDIAYQYNVSVNRGAYIIPSTQGGDTSIIDGSPAQKAGLKVKDVITKVNNITIDDKNSLTSALSHYQPGDKITLNVIRNGKTITVNVILGSAPTT
jgi:serine protease Do